MEREFVPYELAVSLKALGFDEPCFGYYWENLLHFQTTHTHPATMPNSPENCLAPTFSQAFRWFREKHKGVHEIIRKEDYNYLQFMGWIYIDNKKINVNSYWTPLSYEEAELACLTNLIEIVESKSE